MYAVLQYRHHFLSIKNTHHGRTARALGLNTIAEIGRERLRRVLQKEKYQGIHGMGVRYYRYCETL